MKLSLQKGLFAGTIVSKQLVVGCALVLLMDGSVVSAVPTLQAGELLMVGHHVNKNKDKKRKDFKFIGIKNNNNNKKRDKRQETRAKPTMASVITATEKAGAMPVRARGRDTTTTSDCCRWLQSLKLGLLGQPLLQRGPHPQRSMVRFGVGSRFAHCTLLA